jgi:hypothetical protein
MDECRLATNTDNGFVLSDSLNIGQKIPFSRA